MSYEDIFEMMQETGLPFAYHHFAEGCGCPVDTSAVGRSTDRRRALSPETAPRPPFLIFLSVGENTFAADNKMYHSFKRLNIELYTDEKSPETEKAVEEILTSHGIFYSKTETYIDSEKLYQILYETEV